MEYHLMKIAGANRVGLLGLAVWFLCFHISSLVAQLGRWTEKILERLVTLN